MRFLGIVLGLLLNSQAVLCAPRGSWILPVTISDSNATIRYQYHAFGKASAGRALNVRGRVWLANADPRSVRAEITVPIPPLDLGDSAALGLFNTIVQGADLPPVTITIKNIQDLCLPETISIARPCSATITGESSFGSITRPIAIPITVKRSRDGFVISGEGAVDPSSAARESPVAAAIQSASLTFSIEIPG